MKSITAAIRYAKALFSLAKEEHRVSDVRNELEWLAALFAENDELREALLTPLHPADERKSVLNAIAERASLSPLLKNFCSYLIDQRRLVAYAAIRDEFVRLADEDAGLINAQVVTASPLGDRRKDRLRRALSERTGREVRLDVSVDPSLIGGAVAKVGDLVFDGSLRTQLSQLRANLLKGS
jgi:F-type H+-transporting ATPase subunit delta